MQKADFKAYICRPWCMFFSEDEKEEMACLGARVAARLAENGCIRTDEIRNVIKDRDVWEKHRAGLGRILCRVCEFCAEDCDFQSLEPSEDLEPCGGYIVLAHLLENGAVELRDLEYAL
ncbi:MAG: hypothetical protein KGY38_02605 [Desulfobacterales bacterium]|nr:hypothetical protein [Desulfobacterales bacterium]